MSAENLGTLWVSAILLFSSSIVLALAGALGHNASQVLERKSARSYINHFKDLLSAIKFDRSSTRLRISEISQSSGLNRYLQLKIEARKLCNEQTYKRRARRSKNDAVNVAVACV